MASLEFATVLLNSGLIPTGFEAVPLEINTPEGTPGGASEFFSKLLGGGPSGGSGSTFPVKEGVTSAQDTSKDGSVNLYYAVVEGVLSLAQHIQGKEVNEKVLFTLVTALQASAVPSCSRQLVCERVHYDRNDHFLAIRGEVLLLVVERLFGVLTRNNAIPPLYEEAKSALNHIAKALSKAVEHEMTEVSGVELAGSGAIEEGFQSDAAKLLEYCCSLIKMPVVSSISTQQTGNAVGAIGLPSESSMVMLTALGLILHLTVNGGPVFRNSSLILSVLKSAVIPSTLGTALLKDLDAFRLSVNVLLTCSISFGPLMVNETETIFRHLFFRVLESKTCSLVQKSLVVEVFRRYIEEPQNLLALFLNYDCNARSQSVYEQMIGYLVALSEPPGVKGSDASGPKDSLFEKVVLDFSVPDSLRRSALATLLLVACSNRQWIERFECDQNRSFTRENSSTILLSHPEPAKDYLGKQLETQGNLSVSDTLPNENDQFMETLRIKEAFRKFLYHMNEAKDSAAAIEFLAKEPLLVAGIVQEKCQTKGNGEKTGFAANNESTIDADTTTADRAETVEAAEEEMESRAEKIAMFLKEKEDYIDKLVIGEFFAKSFRKPYSRLIFVKWIEQHSFTGMALDAAVRLFLGGFKLLGEAEVVDKTMELFAAQYCKENPTAFRSANTALILSFSICMLNTDAHSPHVKDKMTLEGFIRNNRGIDEGEDVDPTLLKAIYERIVSNEIKLRPTKFDTTAPSSNCSNRGRNSSNHRISSGVLESIPILRHLAPVARAITDTVMIPLDAAGNALFNTAQRKQQEVYQTEVLSALKDVIEALDTANALKYNFVEATRIENAIPMWAITVDPLVKCLLCAFERFFTMAEATVLPPNAQAGLDVTVLFLDVPQNREYFDILLRGVVNTVHVCCDFGNVSQAEDLIERLFSLTQLEKVVSISQTANSCVTVSNVISKPRIQLLAMLLNLFPINGASLTTRGWRVAYNGVSLLDLISNGVEGIWKRQRRRFTSGEGMQPPPDTWFGCLENVPPSLDKNSITKRFAILSGLRCFASVDIWLERLFDATEYPSQTRVFMANALVSVCEKELNCSRTFSLTKLFDFVTVCASFSSRMQWRDLWAHASKVFTLAGKMSFDIATSALGGLRIIALTYLMREELLNYSFQKEVLIPFEAILMGNQNVIIRQKVIETIAELIDFRASHLASGWNVVFSILSHSAVIPEVVKSAWDVCERIITLHIGLMKDCFRDLVFCLTSFACNNVDEAVALLSTSYLKACGHWLQFGLEPPPADVCDASGVSEWAGRYKDADSEARAAKLTVGLPRVTLLMNPITSLRTLEKPTGPAVKTGYHLWMSLLEGMIPIILVHPSVRVRSHVICSLWALIGQYAIAFAAEIQDSLFKGILRPVILSLLMHTPVEKETPLGSVDYKLLAFLSLKSMFLACRKHPRLLSLACEIFSSICMTPLSLKHIQSGLVDVVLRICVDLELRRNAYSFGVSVATPELWVSRLVHELIHVGHVDVIHFRRTTGWTELHHAETVTASGVNLDAGLGDEARTAVINTVLTCITDGVITQLLATTKSCSVQEDYLLCCRATRRAYLILALFSSADATEKVFPLLLSGFCADTAEVPEQQLLIPYLCVLVEFVFVLRSSPPTPNETRALRSAVGMMCQTIRHSREFCVRHQNELMDVYENEKTQGEQPSATKKYKGRAFIDVFRSGRAPLTARAKHISRTPPERYLNEWKYLTHILGLKYAFAFDGVITRSAAAENVRDLILLLPSELEEELTEAFLNSCWDEIDVGINLLKGSSLSHALVVLEQKRNASAT
ncbi:ADP-ribosylation factor guanine nucleotide-exchange factor 1(brefeldin A-inhibited) [Trypanosoma grayi]|uniref:ADP-ribosylation factor guanine nucleotide-exchange factor 1(brefeldin A-inhibited) n=1 Tax=Trypanosoma grayi TaxID=71804 RepID=UPI0004F4808B|nr:ADP-ribosylation factor guanine nucleotide-exchange factor 1(brefeldin A-inhibited) [Trypanosoma grayi]KEG08189.1 ADP-ribosylation factor guanine nucleotide-exchange factor 1(brefeldin A-inhibited) [Trypanosoma grayi]